MVKCHRSTITLWLLVVREIKLNIARERESKRKGGGKKWWKEKRVRKRVIRCDRRGKGRGRER